MGETLRRKIVQYAKDNKGKQVVAVLSDGKRGKGECWDLAYMALKESGAKTPYDYGRDNHKSETSYIWSNTVVARSSTANAKLGDIIQYSGCRVKIINQTKIEREEKKLEEAKKRHPIDEGYLKEGEGHLKEAQSQLRNETDGERITYLKKFISEKQEYIKSQSKIVKYQKKFIKEQPEFIKKLKKDDGYNFSTRHTAIIKSINLDGSINVYEQHVNGEKVVQDNKRYIKPGTYTLGTGEKIGKAGDKIKVTIAAGKYIIYRAEPKR